MKFLQTLLMSLVLVTVLSGVETHHSRQQSPHQETLDSLAGQLLESMGIEKLPNPKNANISAEEYARMYRVYEKSVEQTELLKELRQTMEKESSFEQAENTKLHLEPTGHTRVKRSSSEYWDEDSSESVRTPDEISLFLNFKNKKLEEDRGANHENLLVVTSATLHVNLVRSVSEEEEAANDELTSITLTLIQLVDDHSQESGITIGRVHIKAADVGQRKTVNFDVGSTVQSWVLKPQNNHGFQVVCHKCEEARVNIDDVSTDTWLEVEGRDSNASNWWKRVSHRRRSPVGTAGSPFVDDVQIKSSSRGRHHLIGGKTDCRTVQTGGKKSRCCRSSMRVDLRDIPAFEFIQQPTTFDAHVCLGRCPPRYNPSNDHSLLQSLMHLKTQNMEKHERIPRPCCSPSKMEPLDILHIDENDPTRLRVTHWKNVIVGECKCS